MAIRRLTPLELAVSPDESPSPLDREDVSSIALSTVLSHEEQQQSTGLNPFPKSSRLKSITGKNLTLKQLRTMGG